MTGVTVGLRFGGERRAEVYGGADGGGTAAGTWTPGDAPDARHGANLA